MAKKSTDLIECEICGCEVKIYLANAIDRNRYKADVNPIRVRSYVRLCTACFREDCKWEESLKMWRSQRP